MTYQINPYVKEQNHHRFHAAEQHYINQLESRGGLIRLANVAVDAEQLVLRAFRCDSRWCLRTVEKEGVKTLKGCCCTDLEVDVTETEIGRLRELGRKALEQLTFAARDPLGDIARRMSEGNITEVTDHGDLAFIHMKSRRCPLGWVAKDGSLRCGINALCDTLKLPLNYYKPDPCFLFPLHYVEYKPGLYFMTVVSKESHKAVGADAYVTRLRCLSKPAPGWPPALVSLKWEIVQCLGEEFYRALAAAARPMLEKAGQAEHAAALAAEAEPAGA